MYEFQSVVYGFKKSIYQKEEVSFFSNLISTKASFTALEVKFLNKSSETNFITPDHGCGQGYNEHISKVGKRESMIT